MKRPRGGGPGYGGMGFRDIAQGPGYIYIGDIGDIHLLIYLSWYFVYLKKNNKIYVYIYIYISILGPSPPGLGEQMCPPGPGWAVDTALFSDLIL